MGNRDTYRDTLLYAVAIAGSDRELAGHLRITVRLVRNWLDGVDEVPEPIFQAALDLIIGCSPQAIVRSRGFLYRLAR